MKLHLIWIGLTPFVWHMPKCERLLMETVWRCGPVSVGYPDNN